MQITIEGKQYKLNEITKEKVIEKMIEYGYMELITKPCKLIDVSPENIEKELLEDVRRCKETKPEEKPTQGKFSDGGNWIGGTGWNFTYEDKECKEGKNTFEAGVEYKPVGPNGEEVDLYELIHGPREKPKYFGMDAGESTTGEYIPLDYLGRGEEYRELLEKNPKLKSENCNKKPDHDKAMEIAEVPEYKNKIEYIDSLLHKNSPEKAQIAAITNSLNAVIRYLKSK